MVDGLQLLDEHRLGILDVAESNGTLAEVAFSHLRVDKTFHQVANALFRIVGQRTGGRLNRIGHHQARLFTGKGVGTGIGEQQVIDRFIRMFIMIMYIEILGLALAVMGRDEITNDLGQIILVSHSQTFRDVTDDNLRTVDVAQRLVGIDARLVLGEVDGVRQFSNVMIQGTGTDQLGFGANLVGDLTCQIRHLDGVVEGAWCHLTHASKQGTIGIGKLNERNVAGESKGLLDNIQQRIGKEQGNTVDQQVVIGIVVYLRQCISANPVEGQVDGQAGQGNNDCRLEQLRALRQFAQRGDGCQTCHGLNHDEFERML